jgi:Dienelactone hydrolase family
MNADHSFASGFDFESWKDKHVAFAVEIVPKWIAEVKTEYGKASTKYACVGLVSSVLPTTSIQLTISQVLLWCSIFHERACWRDSICGSFCSSCIFEGESLLKHQKCAIIPCFEFRSLILSFLEPLFLSCAENDVAFDTESRRKATDVLISEKKDYHVQLFSGVEHGFALKGNITKPYERKSTCPWTKILNSQRTRLR